MCIICREVEKTDTRQALTPQQKIFVEAVKNGVDKTRAAEFAGYSHPAIDGCRQMAKPKIKAVLGVLPAENGEAEKPPTFSAEAGKEQIKQNVYAVVETICELLQNARKTGFSERLRR